MTSYHRNNASHTPTQENTANKPPRKRLVEVTTKHIEHGAYVLDPGTSQLIRRRTAAHDEFERIQRELDRIEQAVDPELKNELLIQLIAAYPDGDRIVHNALADRGHSAWMWHCRRREEYWRQQGVNYTAVPEPTPRKRQVEPPSSPPRDFEAERHAQRKQEAERARERREKELAADRAHRAAEAREQARWVAESVRKAEEEYNSTFPDQYLESRSHRSDFITQRHQWRRPNNTKPRHKRPWQVKKSRRLDW